MKKKALISSVLTILLCLSLIVGSAFALFNDKSTVNAVISSGNVDVTATAENWSLSSTLGTNLPQTSVSCQGNTVVLSALVPGDVVQFDLRIANNSDVSIRYRTRITVLEAGRLWEELVVSVGESVWQGEQKESDWMDMEPGAQDVIVPVTICLPQSAGNNCQGASCSFAYTVEAIQGNADTGSTGMADGLYRDELTGEYHITNANGLQAFARQVNAGDDFSGKTVVLANDVDLAGMLWKPIASFAGEFNGNGRTISNFRIDTVENGNGGLFNVIESGDGERVHDLNIKNVTANVGAGRFGALANTVKGIVNRVTVEHINVTTTSEDAWVGGMCAFMYWPWMNDCTVRALTVDAQAGAEFVAGFSPILQKNSNQVFKNCNVDGFQVNIHSQSGALVAGFAGQTQRGWEYPELEQCNVTGMDIVASGEVQIGGFIAAPGAHTTLKNCSVQGQIDAAAVTSGAVGGFFGDLGWNDDLAERGGHKVIGCSTDVTIKTGNVTAGGFVGSATNSNGKSMPASFTDCVVNGSISATGNAAIGGFAGEADRGEYVRCKVNGTVGGEVASQENFIGVIWENNSVVITP